jgi:hypothetical protein
MVKESIQFIINNTHNHLGAAGDVEGVEVVETAGVREEEEEEEEEEEGVLAGVGRCC